MKYTLEEIRLKVLPLARKYAVKSLAVFGSYARGDADTGSDVDILIDCGDGRITSVLKYLEFVDELETVFNRHVDVITTGISDKEFLKAIRRDAVMLYEE